ncbi:MAG: glycoside hydrolase family 3 N-terminal domain-containing protein [Promethearchaeia archaeon]
MNEEKGSYPYQDPSLSVDERVKDLLSRMNIEEKVAQLTSEYGRELINQNDKASIEQLEKLLKNGIGEITRIGGSTLLTPEESVKIANQIQKYLVENTRLGIPAIIHEESLCGYAARKATIFPQAIGLASTWEPDLVKKMTSIIRWQIRGVGAHQSLSPVLDIGRDPRWGRIEETYGEDPYLASTMGVAYVKGLQGESFKTGVIATGKHFLGYGFSQGGRNWGPCQIPRRDLLENFAKPFEAAIKVANIGSIMNSYSEIDGLPCGFSYEVLTDLLRNTLGFKGIVVSDYETISNASKLHRITSKSDDAAILALNAGMDVELPKREGFGKKFIRKAKRNEINEVTINRAVSNVLKMKFHLGLFENPYTSENKTEISKIYENPENKKIARELARKSIVLLKNKNSLLPLDNNIKKIAVIGPNAHNIRNLFGDYVYLAQLEDQLKDPFASAELTEEWLEYVKNEIDFEKLNTFIQKEHNSKSILEAIKESVSHDSEVNYVKGCNINDNDTSGFEEAIDLANRSDIIILVMGGKSGMTLGCTSGESRDRTTLNLPGVQLDMVKRLHETGKPIILVLINGRPLSISWEKEHIPAIIEAWLPGEEGAVAVAEVLFGKYNPGGKLPLSIPRSVGQISLYHNQKPTANLAVWSWNYVEQNTMPLYPFGYGLSYTEFNYSNLKFDKEEVVSNGNITISCDVTNIGEMVGEEVVQLYISDRKANVTRPLEELCGFKRISLQPNETKTISFTILMNQLGFYDENMDFVIDPGIMDVFIGSTYGLYGSELLELSDLFSKSGAKLQGKFKIVGKKRKIAQKEFFSKVAVSTTNK